MITRDMVRRAKPDPDLFLAAAALLGVEPRHAFVVGDSVWDLLAARRAGAIGIGLMSGGYGREELERAGAYRVYADPADLLARADELGVRDLVICLRPPGSLAARPARPPGRAARCRRSTRRAPTPHLAGFTPRRIAYAYPAAWVLLGTLAPRMGAVWTGLPAFPGVSLRSARASPTPWPPPEDARATGRPPPAHPPGRRRA